MGSACAVVLTAIIHLLMRISIFYEQPKNQCSSAPELASWLFVTSVFMLLLDNDIIPVRYRCISTICQTLAEAFIFLVITEFSTLVLWCNIEKVAFTVVKYVLSESSSTLYMDLGGDSFVGFIITIISVFTLCNAAIATGYYDQLQNQYSTLRKGLSKNMSNIWKTGPGVGQAEIITETPRCLCADEGLNRGRRRRSRSRS
ncbi:hypothetical protein ACFFRR_003012 [Megaselia abdita]